MKTNLNREEKYLLACSYGPDSMALFHMLLEEGIYFEVVHVNYHILEQADDDEKGVKEYCEKNNIKLHVLQTYMPKNVNEEDWARTERYDFFAQVSRETGIENILVAQHIDDFIETYCLQSERGFVSYYGIKEISEYKGAKIIRPFATIYTKDELLQYIEKYKIPYSIDPSNLVPVFKRNKIRLEIINNLSREEKTRIVEEIVKKNRDLQVFLDKINKTITNNSVVYKEFSKQFNDDESFYLLLIQLLKQANVFHEISFKESQEIHKVCELEKTNWCKELNEIFTLYLEYGILSVKRKIAPYKEIISTPNDGKLFKIDKEAKNFRLIERSFPLTIKPTSKYEKYHKNGRTFSVNRQFISWKVPLSLRDRWPGIYDSNGTLLYVPKYESGKEKSKGLLIFDLEKLE